jgi:hypothetical protein
VKRIAVQNVVQNVVDNTIFAANYEEETNGAA